MNKISDQQIERDKNYLIRVIEWFDIKKKDCSGNFVIGEEELKNLDLNDLREIFNVSGFFDPNGDIPYDYDDDPHMHETYEVTEEHILKLQPSIEHQIELSKYQYLVTSYARS